MTLYLVVSEDRHRDDCYWIHQSRQTAIARARVLTRVFSKARAPKGGREVTVVTCDGSDGWWFSESIEDVGTVCVREIDVYE